MAAPQNYVSVSRRPPDIEDYIDMLRRHRSWIIAPVFAGLVISVVVAFLWPDTYEARATLRIRPQSVPEELIPTIKLQLSQRLDSLRTEILSRPNLATIIAKPSLNLYPRLRTKWTNEDAIDQMQKDVRIGPFEVEGQGDRRYATLFQVQFSYPDRVKAKNVVDELVGQFVSLNLTAQRVQATATVGFLADQKQAAKERLDQLEKAKADFRSANMGRLPENGATNSQMLSNLMQRMSQANESLSRVQQNKNVLETSLATRVSWQSWLANADPADAPAQALRSQKLAALDNQIRAENMNLAALRQFNTDKHPLVQEQLSKLKVLREQLAEEEAKEAEQAAAKTPAASARSASPQQQAQLEQVRGEIAAIKTQIQNSDLEVQTITKEKLELERQIRAFEAKLETSPLVEQQYAELTRDHATAKERYEELLRKEQLSETAKSLEERRFGETLELLEPAAVPQSPEEPNRYMFAGIGTGLGLMIGLVLAGAREAKDTSLKNLKDVRAYTNLPVLSSIPLLENALLVRRKRRLFWLAWSTAVIIGVGAMAASMWYYFFVPHSQ